MTERTKWRARGAYAIENPHGYTISKAVIDGRTVYTGWLPGSGGALIYTAELDRAKQACDLHREQSQELANAV